MKIKQTRVDNKKQNERKNKPMNTSRRDFLGGAAALGGLALTGCVSPIAPAHYCRNCRPGRVALQLYSLNKWIPKLDPKDRKAALAKALVKIREIGFEAVEFAGYYGANSAELKKMLSDAGLLVCGTHVGNNMFGFNTSNVAKMTFDAGRLRDTCEFELAYGNSTIICPGGGNFPGKGQKLDDFLKGLVDLYNQAAMVAARYGCRIGLHNHTREFQLKMADGTTYWDYFFTNTIPLVQMQQDVGWTSAGRPARAPTLCCSTSSTRTAPGRFTRRRTAWAGTSPSSTQSSASPASRAPRRCRGTTSSWPPTPTA